WVVHRSVPPDVARRHAISPRVHFVDGNRRAAARRLSTFWELLGPFTLGARPADKHGWTAAPEPARERPIGCSSWTTTTSSAPWCATGSSARASRYATWPTTPPPSRSSRPI